MGKGKLPLFCGNVERLIPIYGVNHMLCETTNKYYNDVINYNKTIHQCEKVKR